MNAGPESGSSNDLPWASVFDSAANMRALSGIQADGFRAASELVDRFVRMASTQLDAYGEPTRPATAPSEEQRADLFGATGLEPFVRSWWAMVDRFLTMSTPRTEQPVTEDVPTLDLSNALAAGCIHLETVSPGSATAELWLHNRGTVDMGKIRLRSSDLLAHDGSVLAAEGLRFEPDVVAMPTRSGRGVTIEIEVGEGNAPGRYRGMVLADGHPDVWLPVELVVKPLLP